MGVAMKMSRLTAFARSAVLTVLAMALADIRDMILPLQRSWTEKGPGGSDPCDTRTSIVAFAEMEVRTKTILGVGIARR